MHIHKKGGGAGRKETNPFIPRIEVYKTNNMKMTQHAVLTYFKNY